MKAITIYSIILLNLALIGITYGFIQVQYYGDVKIKMYSEIISFDNCTQYFDLVPEKYYQDLDYIKIKNLNLTKIKREGSYVWGTAGINLFDGCDDMDTLIHELGHHWQKIEGDYLYQGLQHKGQFCHFYHKIWNDTFPTVYSLEFEWNYNYYCEEEFYWRLWR